MEKMNLRYSSWNMNKERVVTIKQGRKTETRNCTVSKASVIMLYFVLSTIIYN